MQIVKFPLKFGIPPEHGHLWTTHVGDLIVLNMRNKIHEIYSDCDFAYYFNDIFLFQIFVWCKLWNFSKAAEIVVFVKLKHALENEVYYQRDISVWWIYRWPKSQLTG
jgi:hypothetical protein